MDMGWIWDGYGMDGLGKAESTCTLR
jgi:hypothetical protein